jgi:hypothetical protein
MGGCRYRRKAVYAERDEKKMSFKFMLESVDVR